MSDKKLEKNIDNITLLTQKSNDIADSVLGTLSADEFNPDIVLDVSSDDDIYIENNKLIIGEEVIPPYKQLEYIESTGTQYIDLGIYGNDGLSCKAKIQFTEVDTDNCVLGSRTGSTRFYMIYNYPQGKFDLGYYDNYNTNINCIANTVYEIEAALSEGRVSTTINKSSYSTNVGTRYYTDRSLALFCNHYDDNYNYPSKLKLYYLKLYFSNSLLLDLIPVKRTSDNIICLYDKINNKFYTNRGTGEFIGGGEVE